MIINYLREFVEGNHRIIIPNVGAFLRKNNATIPFEASITFSPFLRFNDELLENLLMEKEHIAKEVASEKVREFVQEMQSAIAEKRPFYIKNLGAFYQDERKSVQFIYAETEQEANRKFCEIMQKTEEQSAPHLNDSKKMEKPSVAAAEEKQIEEKGEEKIAENNEEKIAEKGENPPPETATKQAQQLEAISNSLQQWMEKRKKDITGIAANANQPQAPEDDDTLHAAPNVQSDASQALTEQTHHEQEPSEPEAHEPEAHEPEAHEPEAHEPEAHEPEAHEPEVHEQKPQQDNTSFPDKPSVEQENEAKRRRQEAIAHALAEKARKEQARLAAEAEQKRQREATQPSGTSSAPLVPGVWEKDVMGKNKSSSLGIWIFLGTMALAFAVSALVVLYKSSLSDFFNRIFEANVENMQPVSPSATVNAPQHSTPPPADAPTQPNDYYIIAGVFNFEDNAHTVSQKLNQTKNLKSEVVKLRDGKFAVSLGKYRSKNAAAKNIDRFKRQHSNVWVAY
ncbi:MAG: SPOR domain-containing protein [Prevotellaceae bacterium]|jgi:nucleoid DNA-binding protein|nr:SPOR domain-containing protein [Prevotellaceae bacterium]